MLAIITGRVPGFTQSLHHTHCGKCALRDYNDPPYGVLWVARYDGQARKLSKTKSSSAVPEAPFCLEKDVQQNVDVFIQVLGCSCLCLTATYREHSVS